MTAELQRFVDAQDRVFEEAMTELAAGRKVGHWMWFVFPQARSLGRSPTALLYGLGSLAETRAYLAHPLLRRRLERAAVAATAAPAASLNALLGSPDDLKFRSSMTLFAETASDPSVFKTAMERWGVDADPWTVKRVLAAQAGPDRL